MLGEMGISGPWVQDIINNAGSSYVHEVGSVIVVLSQLDVIERGEFLRMAGDTAVQSCPKKCELLMNLAHRYSIFGFNRSPEVRKPKGVAESSRPRLS